MVERKKFVEHVQRLWNGGKMVLGEKNGYPAETITPLIRRMQPALVLLDLVGQWLGHTSKHYFHGNTELPNLEQLILEVGEVLHQMVLVDPPMESKQWEWFQALFQRDPRYRYQVWTHVLQDRSRKRLDRSLALLHAAGGIGDEASEVVELVQQIVFGVEEGEPNNAGKRKRRFLKKAEEKAVIQELKNEVGDLLFYLQALLGEVDLDLWDAMDHNIDKLKKRHTKGFNPKWKETNG